MDSLNGKINVQDVKKQLQEQMMVAAFQDLVEEVTGKCFQMCIKKPGASLDSYEQRCLGNCMDRFIDSYNSISRLFTSRLSTSNDIS